MGLFRWGAEFRVGVHDIDEQHKKIVDLINSLHDAMVAGQAAAVVSGVLAETQAVTRHHFSHEEALMGTHAYPERGRHTAEHERFLARIGDYAARHAAGEERVALEAVVFLVDWLAEHNQGSDQKLAQYLKACGVS